MEKLDLRKKLREKIKENKEESDIHQSILNIGYTWWQNNTNKNISYSDMINHIENEYGELAACMILLGKYNQQVCNGGHSQYFNNGYADGEGGCFNTRNYNHPLHKKMIQFIEKQEVKSDKVITILKTELLSILKRFYEAEFDLDETIEEEVEIFDDDGEGTGHFEYEEVQNDNYGQFIDQYLIDQLDNDYYRINDYLMVWYIKLISDYLYRRE